MSATYELWRSNDSCTLLEGPQHPNHAQVMNEPGAVLMLKFKAEVREEAVEVMERFCYGGNPDGLDSLEIPASELMCEETPTNSSKPL